MTYGEYVPPAAPPKNSLAVVSMVSGIVSWVLFFVTLCFNFTLGTALAAVTAGISGICSAILACVPPVGWIVAIITGHAAKSQIRQSGAAGGGMATAGLIMGYIGVGLLVLSLCLVIAAVIAVLAFGASIPLLDSVMNGYY